MKNLSHSASFHCWLNNAPSNAGTKHLGRHGRFPSKAGSIRGQQKEQHLWSLLLPLAGFRRTVPGNSRSKNAVKSAAYWALLDVSRASIGAEEYPKILRKKLTIKSKSSYRKIAYHQKYL
ncbi:MAG: hypothetical protein V4472_09980 [Pseudomonadota bacterium]